MADKKITDSSIPFADNLSDDDVFHTVDVSDTTDDAEGTSKKGLFSLIKNTILNFILGRNNTFTGENTFENDVNINNNKLTNVSDGEDPNDAVNFSQLESQTQGFIPLTGTTNLNPVSGNIEILGQANDLKIYSDYDAYNGEGSLGFNDGFISLTNVNTDLLETTSLNISTGQVGVQGGKLNMLSNRIELSNIAGDIQFIDASTGDIEIGSDAYRVLVTSDSGLEVSNGIIGNNHRVLSPNPAFYSNIFANNVTAVRTIEMPDNSGTVLLDTDFKGYKETGTRAGGDLIVTLGDYDNAGTDFKVDINTEDGELLISEATSFTRIGGSSITTGNGTASVTLEMNNITLDRNLQYPDDSGEVALKIKEYTVSTLPTGSIGDTAYVTDAVAPTYLGTLTGGGTVVCPVFYNGNNWVSH